MYNRLPLIVGPGANTAAKTLLPLVEARPGLAKRLAAMVRVDDRRWDLRLRDGAVIMLPAGDDEGGLQRLDRLDQSSKIMQLGLARIDLRDPAMLVVRPHGAPAPVTAPGGTKG